MTFAHSATHFTPASRKFSTLRVRSTSSTNVLAIKNKSLNLKTSNLLAWLLTWKKGTLAYLFLCLTFFLYPASAEAQRCPSTHIDRQARIKYVHDGDTVVLENGDKIRLIGINAPEIARRARYRTNRKIPDKAEPYGNAARDFLKQLLPKHTAVALQYGRDRKDHYGRTLAHLFLPDGSNIQVLLLKKGLASALMIPPNTDYARCYLKVEKQARCQKVGLWSSKHSILSGTRLKSGVKGFHLVMGKVTHVDNDAKGIWIHLKGRLTLGIRPENFHLFGIRKRRTFTRSLIGKNLLVRGWLNKSHHHQLYMRIRHPLSLEVVDKNSCL